MYHILHQYLKSILKVKGFSCGSDGKESACNAGDLGWTDPLEKGKATHSSFWPGEFHEYTVHGVAKSRQTQLSDLHFHFKVIVLFAL